MDICQLSPAKWTLVGYFYQLWSKLRYGLGTRMPCQSMTCWTSRRREGRCASYTLKSCPVSWCQPKYQGSMEVCSPYFWWHWYVQYSQQICNSLDQPSSATSPYSIHAVKGIADFVIGSTIGSRVQQMPSVTSLPADGAIHYTLLVHFILGEPEPLQVQTKHGVSWYIIFVRRWQATGWCIYWCRASPGNLQSFHQCRMKWDAIFLSDIVLADKDHIDRCFLASPLKNSTSISSHDFTEETPTAVVWAV